MQNLKSTYQLGESVVFSEVKGGSVSIYKNDKKVAELPVDNKGSAFWYPSYDFEGAFVATDPSGNWLAFDCLASWTQRPRYGFLCEFNSEENAFQKAGSLIQYSSNAVQFYDWHYRHENLVSPTDSFIDPLGREQNHQITRTLIETVVARGIAAMGYVAAYACSNEAAVRNPDWLLYDDKKNPMDFHGFLKITNIGPDSVFRNRILDQSKNALDSMGFTGIHFDQYGEPKKGISISGEKINVGAALADLVSEFKNRWPSVPATLNAVKNWPQSELADSAQDFYYMELWEETNGSLKQVAEEILSSRFLSNNKGTVVAIYIPASFEATNQIVDSIIQACGSWRIEFGEIDGFLSDPYFPKFEKPKFEFLSRARDRAYFSVATGDTLRGKIPNWRVNKASDQNVFVLDYTINDKAAYAIVNLGSNHFQDHWDRELSRPQPISQLAATDFEFGINKNLKWFSPESPIGSPVTRSGKNLLIDPAIVSWGILREV